MSRIFLLLACAALLQPVMSMTWPESRAIVAHRLQGVNGPPILGPSSNHCFDCSDGGGAVPAPVVLTALPEMHLENSDLPTSWDWRAVSLGSGLPKTSFAVRVRNQHLPKWCGSCWAHAATAVMGSRWKIHSSSAGSFDLDFSEQYFVNCEKQSHGCGGGSSYRAFALAHEKGAVESSCAAYVAENRACSAIEICKDCPTPGNCSAVEPIRHFVAEYGRVGQVGVFNNEDAMMKEIFARGPIACCTAWPDEIKYHYESGIFSSAANHSVCEHLVSVVGFGREQGVNYWIAQHSAGSSWGENGYYRIKRSSALKDGEFNLALEKACSWAMPKISEPSMSVVV